MNNSIKFKRRLNHFLTYFYLVALSIIIIYPLLITIMSAFKTGNVLAFKLDTDINFSLENFSKLFTETLYGTWYFNTLIIAILTMIIQTSIVVLAGYAYSRYNFLARKQSLVFFLIIQMVPTMAALTAFFVMALMLNALNQSWFLSFLYVGGGILAWVGAAMSVEDKLISHTVEPYALLIKIGAVILVVGASLLVKKLKK